MRTVKLTAIFLFTACTTGSEHMPARHTKTAVQCVENRTSLLSLDQSSFDQDLKGGWRVVADKEGCLLIAADLIRDYRNAHETTNRTYVLFWHEGQLRAELEQTEEALSLFKNAYQDRSNAWNYYADATIAYLERDKSALLKARKKLSTLPKPSWWNDDYIARYLAAAGNRPSWPAHLKAVDSLISCFEKPYSEVFSPECSSSLK